MIPKESFSARVPSLLHAHVCGYEPHMVSTSRFTESGCEANPSNGGTQKVRDVAGIRSRGVCQTGNGMACFQALQPTPLGVRPQQRVPRGDAPPQLTFLSEEK